MFSLHHNSFIVEESHSSDSSESILVDSPGVESDLVEVVTQSSVQERSEDDEKKEIEGKEKVAKPAASEISLDDDEEEDDWD